MDLCRSYTWKQNCCFKSKWWFLRSSKCSLYW